MQARRTEFSAANYLYTSVAWGPKFRPQNTKIVWSRENWEPNLWQIYQNRVKLFCSLVLH
jgi:hypothetical protein